MLQHNESTIGQTPLDRVPVKLFFAYLLQDHNKEQKLLSKVAF